MYLLILINIILLVSGQILWKIGVTQTGFQLTANDVLRVGTNRYVVGGALIYVLATFIWLYVLSKKDISEVYPLQSLCYVLALLVGWLFFSETISTTKCIGVAFIVVGAFFVSIH